MLPDHPSHLEAVAANLYINNTSIVIISYYNRPNHKVSTALLLYAAQLNHAIVLGDFNARHTDYGDTLSNPSGRLLNSLLTDLALCRMHNTNSSFISHQGCSIPDHILITENLTPSINLHCNIGTTVTSDHLPLTPHFLFDGPPPPPDNRLQTGRLEKISTNYLREPAGHDPHDRPPDRGPPDRPVHGNNKNSPNSSSPEKVHSN
jgi:hypothetical protein